MKPQPPDPVPNSMSISTALPKLVLASASPRRQELLSSLAGNFEIDPADIDESRRDREAADEYAIRIAEDKALAVARRHPGAAVLGADTAVVLDDRILGKPRDDEDAIDMLRSLSGRRHRVLSAVCLKTPESVRPMTELSVTEVEFAELPTAWIEAYVASGEPRDKAGAYAIQGGAGAWIRRIEGSYTGVVGLPLFETAGLLRRAGLLGESESDHSGPEEQLRASSR